MPVKSEKQRRFMYAAAQGKTRKGGITPNAAKAFLSHGKKRKK